MLEKKLLLSNKVYFFTVLVVDVGVLFLALADLKIAPFLGVYAGWALLIAGFGALYLVAATLINTTFGKSIVPLPAPFVK